MLGPSLFALRRQLLAIVALGLVAVLAALVGPAARAIGKLNGLTTANTPCGRRIERVWTAWSPRLSIG